MSNDPRDLIAQQVGQQLDTPQDLIARQVGRDAAVDLRRALLSATGTSPDEAANIVSLAKRTGLPAPVIKLDPKRVQVSADVRDWDAILQGSPTVRRFMTDPINAALSKDEIAKLAGLESHWTRDVADVLRALPGGAVETAGRTIQGFGDLYGAVSRGLVRAADMGLSAVGLPTMAELDKRIGIRVDPRVTPQGIARAAGQPLVNLGAAIAPPEERQTLATDISAGVGQIATQIVGLLLSGGTAGTSMLFAQGANQMEERARRAGVAGTPEADAAVQLGAAITGLSEKLGLDMLLNRVAPPVRNAIMRRLLDLGAAGGIEAVQETIEGILQNLTERALINPNAPIFEGLEREAAAAGGAGAIARGLLMAITPGRQQLRQRSIADASTTQIEAFDGWLKATGDSALLQRAPDRFGQLVDQITPDTRVFLPADKVVEFFQSMPTELADQLARDWGIADQVRGAVATGGDVVMTVGQYRQHIEAAQAHEFFKMDLRLSAGGMSLNEAKTFDESYQRFVEQQTADQAQRLAGEAQRSPGQQVFEDVAGKAREAGFTEDVARQYAALYAARYQARGARLGVDAMAAYQRSGLEIRRVMPEALARVPPDQTDLLLDAWRKGKAAASRRQLMGPSLLEFVSKKGGVVDDGGELVAMGVDKWHRGKPGAAKIVRDKAKLSLDDMTQDAWDAGYFPEFTERPTIDDLLEAMREEMAGRKRHVADNARAWRADYAQALKDLDEAASVLGFGRDTPNAEIKRLLDSYGEDAGGYQQAARGIDAVLAAASERGHQKATADLGGVSEWLVGEAKEVGLSIEGFRHAIDASAVRHIRRSHSQGKGERARGQLPVTDEDLRLLPSVISAPDLVVFGTQNNIGRDQIAYIKRMDDGSVLYLEEARTGRHLLAAVTLRKYPATMNADSIVSTLDPYGRLRSADGGDALKIVTPPAGSSATEYQQPDGSGLARGKIAFGQGRSIISLFARADLSTFLHETGHLWLEELRADSVDSAAQQQVRDDWAAVEKVLGIEPGAAPTVEQHERWARAVEAYLMEGKAPSLELGGVFQRFKSWLVSIYRTLSGLNSPINDDIRRVMDRLIATDEQIELARTELQAQQLFASADQAGMTEAEFAAYTESVARARSTAETELLAKAMAEVKRRRAKEWKAEADRVRVDVVAEVDQRPVLNALHFLRTGKTLAGEDLGGRFRLSKDALLDMYGSPTILDAMPQSVPPVYVEAGGAHPDLLAESLGFGSGREMIDALLALEVDRRARREAGDRRSARELAIQTEVERIMLERHGDMLNDGSIQREALEAIHNEDQLEVLATELRALGRRAGFEPSPLAVIRRYAVDHIAGQPVRDAVDVALHRRAEAKAGRAVLDAVLAGDHEEAYRQKQKQMIAHALYIEATRARGDVERGQRLMERYADRPTIKSMDQGYLDQIHGLLERFDFARASQKAVERRISLRDFAARMDAEGRDVAIPEALLDEARQQHYTEMSVEEFRGLADSVRHLAHLGRMKKKLILKGEQQAFEAVRDDVVARINAQIGRMLKSDARNEPGALNAIAAQFRKLDADLMPREQLIEWLTGRDTTHPLHKLYIGGLADAQTRSFDLRAQVTERLVKLWDASPEGWQRRMAEMVDLPELPDNRTGGPTRMLRRDFLVAALNVGTESNYDKMTKGESWEREQVEAALRRLMTKEDWAFVREVWSIVGSLWPEIEAFHRRVNGVAPPKIEPRMVETPFGSFEGAYWPIVYDPLRAGDVADRAAAREGMQARAAGYTRALPSQGYSKARSEGFARSIWFSLDILPRHLDEVIHDITHREAIIEIEKLLMDKEVRAAIEDALGPEYYKSLRQNAANVSNRFILDPHQVKGVEQMLRYSRTAATVVGLGLRLQTIYTQGAGLFDGISEIGPTWMARGLTEVLRDPMEAQRRAFELSGVMRHRAEAVDRDVSSAADKLAGKQSPLHAIRQMAFTGIRYMDRAVTLPIWWGALRKAIEEKGLSQDEAISYADAQVRQSQGAGGTMDLNQWQQGGEAMKLWTTFMSYMARKYGRLRDLGRRTREVETVGDAVEIANRFFWTFAAAPLVVALLKFEGPDDDEDWGGWVLRKMAVNLFGTVPVVRDVANVLERKFSGEPTRGSGGNPVVSMGDVAIQNTTNFAKAVGLMEGEPSDKWAKQAIEGVGYAFALPLGQPAATATFLWDVFDGTQRPEDFGQWMRGLIKGEAVKKR